MRTHTTIAILASLDTKKAETSLLKDLIAGRGHRALLIDVNMGGEPAITADYTARAVAEAGGGNIDEIRKMKDTGKASAFMIAGATKILQGLVEKGEVHGIVGFGGTSNTTMATSVMKAFPFGIPKLVLTSMVAIPAYAAQCFGTRDIAALHSVVDIAGLNSLVEDLLRRTAGAICGMVEMQKDRSVSLQGSRGKGLVALTEFKFSEHCTSPLRQMLEDKGYVVIPFHAQGTGDRAMEELVADGVFDAVIDIVPAGVGEELLGGNRAGGPGRLESAGRAGIPQIIAPCGFDALSCGPLDRGEKGDDPLWVSRQLKKRKLFIPDAFRVQARINAEELTLIAAEVARKLNMARGPVVLMIPKKGWSSLDKEGMPLWDPDADAVFVAELRKLLDRKIRVVELDCNLDTREFAEEALKLFLEIGVGSRIAN